MADMDEKAWEQSYSDMVYWKWQGVPTEQSAASVVAFIEKVLELAPGAKVLDLGSALGHYAVEFARRGYTVTGVEWSERFIEKAKERAAQAGVIVDFIQGDMTRLNFAGQFDAVVLWGNTFGTFTHEENLRTLAGMRRALKPGGQAILETENHKGLGKAGVKDWRFDTDDENLLYLLEDTLDITNGRFGFDVTALDVKNGRQHKMRYSWRLYLMPELREILQAAGMEVTAVYGDDENIVDWEHYESGEAYPYTEEAFTESSGTKIVVCRAI
jgi:SAM-dependent methyltransferase